jgi:hypothetical protein
MVVSPSEARAALRRDVGRGPSGQDVGIGVDASITVRDDFFWLRTLLLGGIGFAQSRMLARSARMI